MSTIFQRKDKGNGWYIEYKNTDGKLKRKSLRTKDKREAQRLQNETDRELVRQAYCALEETPYTVGDLIDRYIPYAHELYGPNSGDHRYQYIKQQVGEAPIPDFGPLALKALRQTWVDSGCCRRTCNAYTKNVVLVFAWGVSEQMVSADQIIALRSVKGLRKHEGKTFDYPGVTVVSQESIQAVLDTLLPTTRDMVRLQYLTAARPGEILLLRPCDLDRSGKFWRIQVTKGNEDRRWNHKTEYQNSQRYGNDENSERWLYLCDEAREILERRFKDCQSPTEYYFNPQTAIKEWSATRVENATGRVNRKNAPSVKNKDVRDHYDTQSYAQAVRNACERAKIPRWTPNQLRHTRATEIERKFAGDKEAVRVLLGHKNINTQRYYVLEDQTRAFDIVAEI
jgi:integrase